MCKDFNCTALMIPENIIGMQGQLWSETVRSPSHLHYMVFPRMIALAERAWHKVSDSFVNKNDKVVANQYHDKSFYS